MKNEKKYIKSVFFNVLSKSVSFVAGLHGVAVTVRRSYGFIGFGAMQGLLTIGG